MAPHQFVDDPTVSNDSSLWRRIPPWHFVMDENLGRIRPSSAAFDDDEMSVVLAAELHASGRVAEDVLSGYSEFAIASITAGLARSKQQLVVRDPIVDEPAHALVCGKKTSAVKKAFSRESLWVLLPPQLDPPC